MYQASEEFHNAVKNNNPQMCLLMFDDLFFSNEDISLDVGVNLTDVFCATDDLSIGQAISNELSFELFNDKRLLNDYDFGEFFATIGVMTKGIRRVQTSGAYLETPLFNRYEAMGSTLRKNDGNCPVQPNFGIGVLIYKDGYVTVVSDDFTQAIRFMDNNSPTAEQVPVLPFMSDKLSRLRGNGYCYDNNTLKCWNGDFVDTYEFVPLGRFVAERPNVTDVSRIALTCNDVMTKFEEDVPSDTALGITYPITLANLLNRICSYAGVPTSVTSFINSGITVDKRPEEFDNSTLRNVIAWIAEASGSNARINRDGKLILDWLHTTDTTLEETDYEEFNPYWYTVPSVDRLYNRNTDQAKETIVGEGYNCYLIQDNPFLKGAI